MKTIRWLKVKWPIPLGDVSKRLLSQQYNEEVGRGFILESTGKKAISGKFIEKLTERILITDPFGEETESHITTYYVSKFLVDRSSELLELESPPRSIRKLTTELHTLVGLGMEISDLKVNPLTWLQEIESSLSPVSVQHISASGITIPKNGLAKISVSGKSDIREEFSKLAGEKSKTIDIVKFKGRIDECNISAELNKTGAIKFTGHIYHGFKEDVRNCLEHCIKKSNNS